MRILLSLAIVAITLVPAFGDEVPYATPPRDRAGSSGDDINSLGNVMGLTQLRHIKLWFAGRQQDWPLARYELDQIADTLRHAAMFYQNIPVNDVKSAERQLDALRMATDDKDAVEFAKAYAGLTEACNACHKAAQVGFIAIRTPTASPFSDQKF
jgi:hypothetical protein